MVTVVLETGEPAEDPQKVHFTFQELFEKYNGNVRTPLATLSVCSHVL